MRRWIAALALVPALAWGRGSGYCMTQEADAAFADMASRVLSNQRAGVGKRDITRAVEEMTNTDTGRALWMSVVDYVYSRGDYASQQGAIAEVRLACIEATSGS